ncbi:hypothetical protein LEMLEM_LOCUS20615, partial [Lemmus lemmus]
GRVAPAAPLQCVVLRHPQPPAASLTLPETLYVDILVGVWSQLSSRGCRAPEEQVLLATEISLGIRIGR